MILSIILTLKKNIILLYILYSYTLFWWNNELLHYIDIGQGTFVSKNMMNDISGNIITRMLSLDTFKNMCS